MLYIISYLILTSFLSCITALQCIYFKETIGVFFDPRQWNDTTTCVGVMIFGYICVPELAAVYWIYRLCTIKRRINH